MRHTAGMCSIEMHLKMSCSTQRHTESLCLQRRSVQPGRYRSSTLRSGLRIRCTTQEDMESGWPRPPHKTHREDTPRTRSHCVQAGTCRPGIERTLLCSLILHSSQARTATAALTPHCTRDRLGRASTPPRPWYLRSSLLDRVAQSRCHADSSGRNRTAAESMLLASGNRSR